MNYSERAVNNSLNRERDEQQILYNQNLSTGAYNKEPLDFLFTDLDSNTVFVEVKQTIGDYIQFNKKEQNRLLVQLDTVAVVALYTTKLRRDAHDYYEYWYMMTGTRASEYFLDGTLSKNNCREDNGIKLFAEYFYNGESFTNLGISDDIGLNNNDSDDTGFYEFTNQIKKVVTNE